MQISTKTVTFDGDDVNDRIDDLVEKNAEGSCLNDEMDELIGLLHFRNEHTDGSGWCSSWETTDFISEHATSTLNERIKSNVADEQDFSLYDWPFSHINWEAALEDTDSKSDLDTASLTIGAETVTFFKFD